MKNMPKIAPRRALDDDNQSGYLESDQDFIDNNLDAVLWFLENAEKIRSILTKTQRRG